MRHRHNLTHYRLFTGDMGYLLPVGLIEVLPGDTFQVQSASLIRLSPLAAPVMHGMTVRLHSWFVPHRLVWDEWEKFITGGNSGEEAPVLPTMNPTASGVAHYYGANTTGVSALPNRGYNLIFNEFYRDQDLVAEVDPDQDVLQKVAWQKDYFTTSRPWEQRGSGVVIPLTGDAPIDNLGIFGSAPSSGVQNTRDGSTMVQSQCRTIATQIDGERPYVTADLSETSGVEVTALRRALAIQRFQEARARYGGRYNEYLRTLGVRPDDASLGLPEYLGGGRVRVSVSEVLQTGPDAQVDEFGVGDMYGHGMAPMRANRFRRFFSEHGYIHMLLSVRPDAMYTSVTPRHWLKRTKFDFWQKELQHIGQQEVFSNELWPGASPEQVFGYQDRYREYREHPSQVVGEFKNALNYWHLARVFGAEPALNQSFVECSPSKRIFNEQEHHSLWGMVQHRVVARRLVSRSAAGRII